MIVCRVLVKKHTPWWIYTRYQTVANLKNPGDLKMYEGIYWSFLPLSLPVMVFSPSGLLWHPKKNCHSWLSSPSRKKKKIHTHQDVLQSWCCVQLSWPKQSDGLFSFTRQQIPLMVHQTNCRNSNLKRQLKPYTPLNLLRRINIIILFPPKFSQSHICF